MDLPLTVGNHQPRESRKVKVVYCNVNGMSKKTNVYFETLLQDKKIDISEVCEHKKKQEARFTYV